MMHFIYRLSIVSVLALTITACSTPKLSLEQIKKSAADYDQTPSLAALLPNKVSDKPLHVVIVHGMGDHQSGYSDVFVTELAKQMGVKAGVVYQGRPLNKTKNLYFPDDEKSDQSLAENWPTYTTRKATVDNKVVVKFHEFTWGPLSDMIVNCHISHNDQSKDRAACNKVSEQKPAIFNGWMQQFIRTHLADALIYSGDFGEVIRQPLKEMLCKELGGQPKITSSKLFECDYNGVADTQLAFVTHSLGSKIVVDLLSYEPGISGLGMAQPIPVFMMANQLTLLRLINMCKGSICDSVETNQFLIPHLHSPRYLDGAPIDKTIDCKVFRKVFRCLDLVAYNDPNDFLSFEIPSNADVPPYWRAWNISVGNTASVLGLIAWPFFAHTDYWTNPDVIGSIACGVLPIDGKEKLANACAKKSVMQVPRMQRKKE